MNGALIEGTVYIEFTPHHQSNNLTYEGNGVSKRQIAIHKLITYLHESEGMGYRRIAQLLNRSGIKTYRNKTFSNGSAWSVIKRMREREEQIANVRKSKFSSTISNFRISRL